MKAEGNDNVVAQSLEKTRIQHYRELASLKAIIAQLQSKLNRANEHLAREKRTRNKYYNKQCAAKKALQKKISCLQRENLRLREGKQSDENDLNLYERMLSEKDRQLGEKDRQLGEKNDKIKHIEFQYQELLDLYIHTKVQSLTDKQ